MDLRLAVDPERSTWELPTKVPRGWRRGALAWHRTDDGDRGDDLHPAQVMIATALVRHAQVTFPRGTGRLPGWGIGGAWKLGRHFELVHANDVDEALELFDCQGFEWCMGGQVAFATARGEAPPALGEPHLACAFRGELEELPRSVRGMLLAGVDGVIAGLYTRDDSLWSSILGDLSPRIVPEDELG